MAMKPTYGISMVFPVKPVLIWRTPNVTSNAGNLEVKWRVSDPTRKPR